MSERIPTPEEHDAMCKEYYSKLRKHQFQLPRKPGDELSKIQIGQMLRGGVVLAIDQLDGVVWTTR